MLRITRPATSSGRSTAIESPMGPPQSLENQYEPLQAGVVDQRVDPLGVLLGGVAVAGRMVREAEAGIVGGDRATRAAELLDDVAIQERPRGVAVQHHHRRPRPLVHVVQRAPATLQPPVGKGVLGAVDLELPGAHAGHLPSGREVPGAGRGAPALGPAAPISHYAPLAAAAALERHRDVLIAAVQAAAPRGEPRRTATRRSGNDRVESLATIVHLGEDGWSG